MQLSSSVAAPSRKEQTIASILGQPSYQEIDWRFLMQECILVKLTVGRCRFSARLELTDLGITVQDERVRSALRRTMSLGEKRLLPDAYIRQLDRLESEARSSLKGRSIHIERLGPFLPVTSYDDWRKDIDGIQQRYLALRDEIIGNYRELTAQVLAEYEVIARDTYKRLKREQLSFVRTTSEDQFASDYCNQVAALIPSTDRVKDSFSIQWRLTRPMQQIEILDKEMERGDEVREMSQETIARLREQAEQAVWESTSLSQDLRRQAQQEKKAVIDSFLSALVGQMRTLIYDATTDVLATIQKHGDGTFSPRSVVQLKNLIAQVKQLDFYGDQEVETMLSKVQAIVGLDSAARKRSLSEITTQLRAIATVTRATLLDLQEEPRSAREVAIAEYPTEASVRKARLDLGLDTARLAEALAAETAPRQGRLIEPSLSLWKQNSKTADAQEAQEPLATQRSTRENVSEAPRVRRLA